jgi:hypothetical protein
MTHVAQQSAAHEPPPPLRFRRAGFFGRWIRSQRPLPTAVGELERWNAHTFGCYADSMGAQRQPHGKRIAKPSQIAQPCKCPSWVPEAISPSPAQRK